MRTTIEIYCNDFQTALDLRNLEVDFASGFRECTMTIPKTTKVDFYAKYDFTPEEADKLIVYVVRNFVYARMVVTDYNPYIPVYGPLGFPLFGAA